MKRFLILPLLLAACAPAVRVDPVATASRSYATTCADALARLSAVAVRTRPATTGVFGVDSWPPLQQMNSTAGGAAYISTTRPVTVYGGGIAQSISNTVTVLASCVEAEGAATLTLATSGQRSPYADLLNKSLLDGVALP